MDWHCQTGRMEMRSSYELTTNISKIPSTHALMVTNCYIDGFLCLQESAMAQLEMQFGSDVCDVSLVKQGAEARIYTCSFRGKPTVIKERFSKLYRHPALDKSLTVRRTRAETRCIQRCQTAGNWLLWFECHFSIDFNASVFSTVVVELYWIYLQLSVLVLALLAIVNSSKFLPCLFIRLMLFNGLSVQKGHKG